MPTAAVPAAIYSEYTSMGIIWVLRKRVWMSEYAYIRVQLLLLTLPSNITRTIYMSMVHRWEKRQDRLLLVAHLPADLPEAPPLSRRHALQVYHIALLEAQLLLACGSIQEIPLRCYDRIYSQQSFLSKSERRTDASRQGLR